MMILILYCLNLLFFFSSRRRHTRCGRDWSSDVCSSDLSWIRRSCARSSSNVQRFVGSPSKRRKRTTVGAISFTWVRSPRARSPKPPSSWSRRVLVIRPAPPFPSTEASRKRCHGRLGFEDAHDDIFVLEESAGRGFDVGARHPLDDRLDVREFREIVAIIVGVAQEHHPVAILFDIDLVRPAQLFSRFRQILFSQTFLLDSRDFGGHCFAELVHVVGVAAEGNREASTLHRLARETSLNRHPVHPSHVLAQNFPQPHA